MVFKKKVQRGQLSTNRNNIFGSENVGILQTEVTGPLDKRVHVGARVGGSYGESLRTNVTEKKKKKESVYRRKRMTDRATQQ